MDVTTENFKDVLGELEEVFQASEFIAIDCEFTGLIVPGNEVQNYDTLDQVYTKNRKSTQQYIIVQFGISAFESSRNGSKYKVKTYNFNVFPNQYGRANEAKFTCLSSSLKFLASQNFDFNKVVKYGIPYLLPVTKNEQQEIMNKRHQQRMTALMRDDSSGSREPPPVPEKWTDIVLKFVDDVQNMLTENVVDLLELTPGYDQLCRVVAEQLSFKYKKTIHVQIVRLKTQFGSSFSSLLRVRRCRNDRDLEKFEREAQAVEQEELEEAYGFSRVLEMLRKSGNVVVGHNMYFDVLHTMNQFGSPLPRGYREFKKDALAVFSGGIVDTKHLASAHLALKEHLPNTTLEDMHKALQNPPFKAVNVVHSHGFDRYSGSKANKYLHEAGYDAFLTGHCLVSMMTYLKSLHTGKIVFPKLIKKYLNRIHISKPYDAHYVNLDGKDGTEPRKNVFHVSYTGAKKTSSDIYKLFSPHGNVKLNWLDDSSVFVVLSEKELVTGQEERDNIARQLNQTPEYKVKTYDEYVSTLLDYSPSGPESPGNSDSLQTPHDLQDSIIERGSNNSPLRSNSSGLLPGNSQASGLQANGLGSQDLCARIKQTFSDDDEDLGEPVEKRCRTEDPGSPKSEPSQPSDIFDEPSNW